MIKLPRRGPWKWAHELYTYPARGRRKEVKVFPLLLQGANTSHSQDAFDDTVFSVSWPSKKNMLIYSMDPVCATVMEAAPELLECLEQIVENQDGAIERAKELINRIASKIEPDFFTDKKGSSHV